MAEIDYSETGNLPQDPNLDLQEEGIEGSGFGSPIIAPALQGTGHYSSAQASPAFYPGYRIETMYLGETGILQAPVAGPFGTPAALLRKHGGFTQKVVVWEAWRYVEKPLLPHPDGGNPNEVLAKFLIMPGSAVLLPGGQNYFYRCGGYYLYYLFATPIVGTDDFYSGATPLFNTTAEQLKMQGFQFNKDLLKSNPPQSYQGGFISP